MKHSGLGQGPESFDVIVVGAGHAGVEAAAAAGRLGARTALVTHRADRIGEMSCNPAMGGLGKGHLMREVDALDGLIARASDEAGIQFRLLNRSRGPAVRGPRAQIDRNVYREVMQRLVREAPNVVVIEGSADRLSIQGDKVTGVDVSGVALLAGAVVLTAGTFLKGVMHMGRERTEGGRFGDPAAVTIAEQLRALNLRIGRLKTGTPARLTGRSINRDVLEEQPGDETPEPFSFLTDHIGRPQIPCLVTETNPRVHEIIAAHLHESAMRLGEIEGAGPRYCPSIEDKIERFADRDHHNIFLEPETADGELFYPNGVSTSLPANVQEAFLREIRGLEQVEIARYGYAIEYDFIDPTEVWPSLELKRLQGFFVAGQILGTTGYEEAAALGLLAGANAARLVSGDEPLIMRRDQAYLGVMVDDLTTKGVTEPYRMFTSRAEHRLSLRADNADERLTPLGSAMGLVSRSRAKRFEADSAELDSARAEMSTIDLSRAEARELGIVVNQDGRKRSLMDLLAYPGVTLSQLLSRAPVTAGLRSRLQARLQAEATYAGFLSRQKEESQLMAQAESFRLPVDLDYQTISSLSAEQKEKLSRIRPTSLGQAERIEGITPAALVALAPYIKRA